MIKSQYEFKEEQSSYFTRLANKSRWMATGLGFYAISNLYILSQAARKPFTILLSVLMILLSISTALTMLKAGSGFIKITKTQGNDSSNTNNELLQLVMTLIKQQMPVPTSAIAPVQSCVSASAEMPLQQVQPHNVTQETNNVEATGKSDKASFSLFTASRRATMI